MEIDFQKMDIPKTDLPCPSQSSPCAGENPNTATYAISSPWTGEDTGGGEMTAPAVPLAPYQKRWVDDRARFKAGMMSRQSGKTFSSTLEVVDHTLSAAAAGKRESWIILSRGERQAKEALNEGIKRHLSAFNAGFNASEYDWRGADADYRAHEVQLPNGAKITALPANPDTARGFSRNVLLDEFAFHKDSRKIWAAVFPVITRRNLNIRVISTPNGKDNKFYDIVTDKSGAWSVHVTDIYQAVAQGLEVDPARLRAALGDDDAWQQEYELQWLDEASAWLSYDLINAVEDEKAGKPELYTGGAVYIGVDIGRRKDLWAAAVIEQVGDVCWLRELATLRRASFAAQDAELDRLMEIYKPLRVAMDETGLGMKPVEDAKNRYGESMVEGITFTAATKLVMATIGKQAFEDRKIRIPLGDEALRRDLHKLRKTTSPTGAPRFDAAADGDGHADRTWALFLALTAASGPGMPIDYTASGQKRHATEVDGAMEIINADRGFGAVGARTSTEAY